MTCSNASPEGKGGNASPTKVFNGGGSFWITVDSSGFVVSIRIFKPSTPTDPTMSARVVMMDVAMPFNVATLTRETSLPVTGEVLGVISIV